MAESISYIKVGNQDHPIDAVTINGLTLTSQEKSSWNEKQDALTFDSIPTENSDNPVKSGGVYEMITDNELVIATALNDLNDRLLDVEDNSLTSESDPVFMSSPASSITVANISTWNAKQDALTFDSLPTENSDNLVKSGALYTVLTNTELVVATALNDLNQRVSSNQSSISNLYEEIDRALTAVLTYKGTVGSNGDYTSLPSSHEVGDVYVVSSAGTFAGQSCEVGDYIICKTSRSTASDNDWNVVNGENQVSNSAATLAAAGSNVTIATVDGTNITISTPVSWTGVNKNGTLTGVTFNGVSASVSNGVASVSLTYDSIPTENSDNLVKSGDLYKVITDNEYVISTAINDLNDRLIDVEDYTDSFEETDPVFAASPAAGVTASNISSWNSKISGVTFNGVAASISNGVASISLTYDSIPTENSDNLVKSGDLYTVIVDNEEVTAAALNDLNDRMINVENGMVNFSEQDPIFSNSAAASISSANISSWNAKQDALSFDSVPTENSNNLVKSGDLYTVITQNEFVAAAALNDLNDRVEVLEENQYSFDSLPTENSENLVNSGALYSVIVSNERVVATALNDVNDRLMVLENNMSDAFEDVESILQTSEEVTAAALNDLHSRVNALETGSGGGTGGGITGVTFNGTAASISNGIAAISVGVVNTTGDQTVNGIKTFASEVRMTAGGTSDVTSGVLCAFKTNRAQITNLATHNIYTGGTNSSTPITFYKYTSVSSQAPASLVQLAKIDTDGNIYEGTTKLSDKYALISSIPAAVTEATVSGWGFTKNTGTLTTHASHKLTTTNSTATSVSQGTEITFIESLTGTTTATSGDLTVTATRKKVTIPTAVTEATVSGWGFTKNAGTLTGISMNGAAVSVSNGVANLGTVLTSHQSIKTINSQTMTGSGNVTIREIPACTSSDNGKVLQVVNGSWTLVTPVSIYSGSSNPDSSQGTNGDLYLQTS